MKIDPVCKMEVQEAEALTARCNGVVYYFCSHGCRENFMNAHPDGRRLYDLIIIGGGPAALTAAVYASTMKLDAFVIARDLGGQALDSSKIENYMGYDFITGPELIGKFKGQLLHSHYVDHLMNTVVEVEPAADGFTVTTADRRTYSAVTVLVATGMARRRLNVAGEEEFQRRGVFYGNIQDYAFVQGEDVAVIGGGNSALQIVENLHPLVRKIHLISDEKLSADPKLIDRVRQFQNLQIYETAEVMKFTGSKLLSGIAIRTERGEILNIPVKGVFIAIGFHPNSSVLADLVKLNDHREIEIGPDCTTSYPGIFAAGDVTNAFGKRIVIASAEGAKAALAARRFVMNLKKEEQHERRGKLRV
ncbi:MAG: FAD-dependent oxidoreductase [Nitrospiraceae bacterium]|nr:FAD-dependent oxidoreductase [Nitrospiraceae bacterium]